ncbi:hypothetical protein ABPG74_014719 [Tetrahymena malaccensis]
MDKKFEIIPFSPMADIGFWSTLAKKKLEEWKLNSDPQDIFVKFKISNFTSKKAFLNLDVYSFQQWELQLQGPVEIVIQTKLKNYNTIEEFKQINYNDLFKELTQMQIVAIDDFLSGKDENLNAFIMKLVTFADLKKHNYSYKLCSPSIKVDDFNLLEKSPFKTVFSDEQKQKAFDESLKQFLKGGKISPFFYCKEVEEGKFVFGTLREYLSELQTGKTNDLYGVFFDPYNQNSGTHAYFTNLLALVLRLAEQKGIKNILPNLKFILLKDSLIYNFANKYDLKNSLVLSVDLSSAKIDAESYTGCDPNQIPPSIDLKSSLDEATLATDAVDLNIKLMKWRVLPTLDLELLKSTKVLMLGAGTLGCQLSRNLIGWGIKHITFVDYGKISYSNPVRQSLYEFEDTINGGKPKAETAAEKLKKIFPDIVSKGYQIKIPMPGHYLASVEHAIETLKDVDLLEELVKEHDVLYLMTDSRESRWLPTILANKYNKICITVGLGFDSFVIVRHGLSPKVHNPEVNGERLSCYFCNDVISPGNTMKDRTLDQQCTVTRPGLSFVSSAYASELLISLLHHPLKNGAPAADEIEKLPQTDLGILPQHIRGTMGEFETRVMYGRAFEHCVACSEFVLDEYLKDRDNFLQRVINDPDYLQQVTKLSELLRDLEGTDAFIEVDD